MKYVETIDGFFVEVRILKERTAYGRKDLLIKPAKGFGQAWVWAEKILDRKPEVDDGGKQTDK